MSVRLFVRCVAIVGAVALAGGCAGDSADGGGNGGGSGGGGTDATGGGDAITTGFTLDPFTPPEKNAVIGQVISTDGVPLAGATVTSGAATATTNYDGLYALEVVASDAFLVRFEATGYATITKPGALLADGQVTVNAMLPRLSPSVDAVVGGTTPVPGGAVQIPDGAVVDAAGKAVTGVRVRVTPVDVTGPEIVAAPGDFSATTAVGDTAQLETFGMAEYALTDADGKPLQIKDGQTVGIEMLLPADTDLKDGDVVPAWHFDDATGRWVEEGTGTVQPSTQDPARLAFVAQVGHFSWWNCDKTMETTCVSGVVKKCDGTPAAGADVQVEGLDYDGTSSAFAGADGSFCAPARRASSVRVYAATGWGANRLVKAVDATTADVQSTCADGPCTAVDITLPCTPAESDLDCDDTWFAGCKSCLKGKVVTDDGAPIASAKVQITTGKTAFTVLTDAAGGYCAPAALGSQASITATGPGGSFGGVTFTPVDPGACPDCDDAPDITLNPPATGGGSDLDYTPCLKDIGGVSLDPPILNGADPNIATLNGGWASLSRQGNADQSFVTLELSLLPTDTTTDVFGRPGATIRMQLPAPPTGATTYTIAEGETYGDAPWILAELQSRVGVAKGQGNESFDARTASPPVGSGTVRFDSGFSKTGDAVKGSFDVMLAPRCAARTASVRLKGTFTVTYYDRGESSIPSFTDVDGVEFKAWMCDLYAGFFTWYNVDTWWNGVVAGQIDGQPIPIDPDGLTGASTYQWVNDQLNATIYGVDTTVSFTVEAPVSGDNAVTSGYLNLNSGCYYTVDTGNLTIVGFSGADTDTWLSGTFSIDYVPLQGAGGPACAPHTVTGQLGAPVCRE